MLIENINVEVSGMQMEVSKSTTLLELSKMFNIESKHKIILARVNNHYKELQNVVHSNDKIEFCDLTDKTANRVYLNGLIFLVKYSFNAVFGKKNGIIVKHSADKALCVQTIKKITRDDLKKVEDKMREVVTANLPIVKVTVLKTEAFEYFKKHNDEDKVGLL